MRQFPESATLREQIKYSDPDWRPIIAEWDEINVKMLGVAVHEALTGKKTPEQALNDMVPTVSALMKSGGYLKHEPRSSGYGMRRRVLAAYCVRVIESAWPPFRH
jgi:hypothetical protein